MKPLLRSALVLSLLFPYTASYSDSGGQITVVNGTERYLHVVIDGKPFLYVQPGGSVSFTGGSGSHAAFAFYAPGQGIAGRGDTVLTISVMYGTATCSKTGSTCSCTSSSENDGSTSYTSASWRVRPEALEGGAE